MSSIVPFRIALLASAFIPSLALTDGSAWSDEFDTIEPWVVQASDGVRATLALDGGVDGTAMRLDFDFERGGGFCVVRRPVRLALGENYRFTFDVRGKARRNNLELKLVDINDEDVWWLNRRSFEFPREWRTVRQKKRQFAFAWGPSGGKEISQLGWIEFAIAADEGGSGSVWFDRLRFESLPMPQPVTRVPIARVSSQAADQPAPPTTLPTDGTFAWRSATEDPTPTLELDFQQVREVGGLSFEWSAVDYPTAYAIDISADGDRWEETRRIEALGGGGRTYLPTPDAEGRAMRLRVIRSSRGQGVALRRLRVLEVDFSASPNRVFATIARESPRGWYPRYFLDEMQPWTVVGVPGDRRELLIDSGGAIELDRSSLRLEPFIYQDGKLLGWADADATQSLADDALPIPTVTWDLDDLRLEVTVVVHGKAGAAEGLVRYRLTNRSADSQRGALLLALRPFQVLPPWHDLNITGGVANVDRIVLDGGRAFVNDEQHVEPLTNPTGFGASTFAEREIVEHLATNTLPARRRVEDPQRRASAAWRFAFDVPPQGTQDVFLAIPMHATAPNQAIDTGDAKIPADQRFREAFATMRRFWHETLDGVRIELPPSAAQLANTFRTMQAYILINADGPAIQPGSRTYERSWIRDGALTSTALLQTGHTSAVGAFVDWYGKHLSASGKVPCVVDRRGPDPVDEHDSTGQFIHLVWRSYQFTGDRSRLKAHFPAVVAGVDYLDRLRTNRLSATYRDGTATQRACFGLVPESISHEGYSAKPMHSYWDSFFVLRGLRDATAMARVLQRDGSARRFDRLRTEYERALYDSIERAMKNHGIDYIPGCVELGDFDATSTAIALFPCNERQRLPEPALTNTFERYYQFFRDRRDGRMEWEAYTPYELRIVGTYLRLGQPRRAHALLDYFLEAQRPRGWNHWAEVVYREPTTPGFVGDMPHTWVGSAFVSAFVSLFAYADESDESLVLLAGVKPEWLRDRAGVRVHHLRTIYGTLSVVARIKDEHLVLDLDCDQPLPNGGIRLQPMGLRLGAPLDADGVRVREGYVQLTRNRGRFAFPIDNDQR